MTKQTWIQGLGKGKQIPLTPSSVYGMTLHQHHKNTQWRNPTCFRFLQATKMLDKLFKSNKEQEKRKKNVQKMQLDAVSDNEEDEEAAEQMAANAQRQAQALQAEDGDPEPEVLQQVLYPRQVHWHTRMCM